ncbi:MAG: hypothetical protein NUW23_02335 [Firmicutes bacterium]|jgi:hypothetical protein|nr:hypothetical protein [Bacillota bacterium]
MAKRRRQFRRWVGKVDPAILAIRCEGGRIRRQPPRPMELSESDFWRPRVLGRLAKWNGTCAHYLCRGPRFRDRRHIAKAETRRMVLEALDPQ